MDFSIKLISLLKNKISIKYFLVEQKLLIKLLFFFYKLNHIIE